MTSSLPAARMGRIVDAYDDDADDADDGILSRDESSSLRRPYRLELDPSLPGHRWIGP